MKLKDANINDNFSIDYIPNETFQLVKIRENDNDMLIRNNRTYEYSVYSPNTPITLTTNPC